MPSSSQTSSYLLDPSVHTKADSNVPSITTTKRRRREGHLFLPPPPSHEYSTSEPPSDPPSPSSIALPASVLPSILQAKIARAASPPCLLQVTFTPPTLVPPSIQQAKIARAAPPPRLLQVAFTPPYPEVNPTPPLSSPLPKKIRRLSSSRNRNVVKLARIFGENVPSQHSPIVEAFPRSHTTRKQAARCRPLKDEHAINGPGYLATGLDLDPYDPLPQVCLTKSPNPTAPEGHPPNLEVRVQVDVETFVDSASNYSPTTTAHKTAHPQGLAPTSARPPSSIDAYLRRLQARTQAFHVKSRSDTQAPTRIRARSPDLNTTTVQSQLGHAANFSLGYFEFENPRPSL
ncbi:hypothetical protein BD779DRAFT_1676747 [Infundibulicybe gibba]|nr:hypothetical protein BD779DRAFT_1676747 [Infundibulicybe gibba]